MLTKRCTVKSKLFGHRFINTRQEFFAKKTEQWRSATRFSLYFIPGKI